MNLLLRTGKFLFFLYGFAVTIVSANVATTLFQPMWVNQLKNYGNLDIFVLTIPDQTVSAVLKFAAAAENDGCDKDLQIDVVLQRESLPLFDELGTFPTSFEVDKSEQYNITVVANSQVHALQLIYPKPGQWYGTGFHRFGQSHTVSKLQEKKCKVKMAFNVSSLIESHVTELVPNSVHTLYLINSSAAYKFRSGLSTQTYTVTIFNCRVEQGNGTVPMPSCPLMLYASSARMSSQWDHEHAARCVTQASAGGQCVLEVNNLDVDQWQYVTVAMEDVGTVHFQLQVQLYDIRDIVSTIPLDASWPVDMPATLQRSEDIYSLFTMTFTLGEAAANRLNISDQSGPLVTSFSLQSMRDTGGSLRLFAALSNFNQSAVGGGEDVEVTACLQQGVVPLRGSRVSCANPLTLHANNSHKLTHYIPYPKAGHWFVAFDVACYSYNSQINGASAKVPCSRPWFSLMFELGSAPCVEGTCGQWGECRQYATGSLMYASCDCGAGWRGYGCTDSSQLKPLQLQLLDTLLLSLSNLAFIPAIVLASKRFFFMEAIAYTCNMFFSTFYHACDMDEWSTYRLCIMPYHVLQYTDFFCSIMSFWVTLMAMAELPFKVKALAHMLAVYAFSMGLTWKQFGILPYAIPISTGALIVVLAWSVRSYRQKKCVLGKVRCLTIIPGVLAAAFGMSIYVFMETDENYPYTHSLWHVCMSLSCVFLLPSATRRAAGEGRQLRENVCCHEVEMTSENSSDDLPIVSAQYTRWMD